MKIMKRLLVFTISVCLLVLLAACQSGTTTSQPSQPSGNAPASQPTKAVDKATTRAMGREVVIKAVGKVIPATKVMTKPSNRVLKVVVVL